MAEGGREPPDAVGTGQDVLLWRSLLRFALPILEETTTVTTATLKLRLREAQGARRADVVAARVTGPWFEGFVTWRTQPPAGPPSAVREVTHDLRTYEWVVTEVVAGWFDQSLSNYGWQLRARTEAQVNLRGFHSRHARDRDVRPRLELGLLTCAPTATPTPSATLTASPTATSTATASASPSPSPEGPPPSVRLEKHASHALARPGDEVTYTLRLANLSSSVLESPTIADVLPAGTSFHDRLTTNLGAVRYMSTTRRVEWTAEALAPGQVSIVSFRVALAKTLSPGQVVTNVTTAEGILFGGEHRAPVGLSARAMTTVSDRLATAPVTATPTPTATPTATHPASPPALDVRKTVNRAFVAPGREIRYEIRVELGGRERADVRITDEVPAGTELVGSVQAPSGCTVGRDRRTIAWTCVGMRPGGVIVQFRVRVAADAPAGRLITNTAQTVAFLSTGAVTRESSAFTEVVVGARASLRKALTPTRLLPGDVATATIVVQNTSGVSERLVLQDRLPAGADLVPGSFRASKGSVSYDQASHEVNWRVATLLPGEEATLVMRLRPTAGLVDNTVLVNEAIGTFCNLENLEDCTERTAQAEAVHRLDDLLITALEITQSIQNLDNAAPLIRGKPTYARLFVKSEFRDQPGVTAEVELLVDGRSVAVLQPLNRRLTARSWPLPRPKKAERDSLGAAFLFRIPADRLAGRLVLARGKVNSDLAVRERDHENNDFEVARPIVPSPQMHVRVAPVQVVSGTQSWEPDPGVIAGLVERTTRVYPVRRISFSRAPTLTVTVDKAGNAAVYDAVATWHRASTKGVRRQFHFGLVSGASRGLGAGGEGAEPGRSAWGVPDWTTMAHELGHNLDRSHIDCGGPDPKYGLDLAYPYPVSRIADGSARGYYGFDAVAGTLRVPERFSDFMTYCSPEWVSDYTYRALLSALRTGRGAPRSVAPAPAQSVAGLLVPGRIARSGDAGSLGAAVLLPGLDPDESDAQGTFALELRDAGDGLVHRHSFPPPGIHGASTLPFVEVLPPVMGWERLVLIGPGGILAERRVSGQPPRVSIDTPADGSTLAGRTAVRWTGGDPDGDTVTYLLQYSPDGGATWYTVTPGQGKSELVVDGSLLPMSEGDGRLRVAASDGLRTAVAEIGVIVPPHAPEVSILSPADGELLDAGVPAVLVGAAWDTDAPPETLAVSWLSNRDGQLGTDELVVAALSQGSHRLTFGATDILGGRSQVTVRVLVGTQLYLPAARVP